VIRQASRVDRRPGADDPHPVRMIETINKMNRIRARSCRKPGRSPIRAAGGKDGNARGEDPQDPKISREPIFMGSRSATTTIRI
jgi:hypothetical protein